MVKEKINAIEDLIEDLKEMNFKKRDSQVVEAQRIHKKKGISSRGKKSVMTHVMCAAKWVIM